MARAKLIKAGIDSGTISKDFHSFLADSVGFDVDQKIAAQTTEAQKGMLGVQAQTGNEGMFSGSENITHSIAPYGHSKQNSVVVSFNKDAASEWSSVNPATILGTEIFDESGIPPHSKLKNILLVVESWGDKNGLFGKHPTPALKANVEITPRSINNDLSHGAANDKIKSVAALPELLQNAVYIQTEIHEKQPGLT